ncbi:MAG: DegT/DnrJ/EryC1/StrS family aminotransferase [Nitrospirae bacterium]|nr:DegT/DnrJ/EryC1/StrS family aminotransferase [Nitrospirota bacterium]
MKKNIKNWDYLDLYKKERGQILDIVDRVFSSGRLVLGREVEAFEREFSASCGVSCGIGVNSGTDALFLALRALGIKQGDEVITVSNTAVPTVAAIRATGATPVFIDVEEDTFLMDIGKLEAAVTGKTRCVLPVHLYGQPVDMAPLREITGRKGLHIVEDCAQAAGALYGPKSVGGFGDLAAFSFYPTKVLGGYGDAGMVVTDDRQLCEKVRRLRFYGMDGDYYSIEEGYNSRLDEVQAALLRFRLAHLDEAVRRRREIAAIYSDGLAGAGDLTLPVTGMGRTHQFYTYTVRTQARAPLMKRLAEAGIETRINYRVPVHLMEAYAFLGYRPGDLPVTERLSREILSLPLHQGLTEREAGRVVSSIRKFFGSAG